MGSLDIQVLGSFEVGSDGLRVEVGGLKRRGILAMLALRVGEVVSDDELIDGVWGDRAPTNVRNSIQANIGYWRRAVSGLGCGELIHRRRSGYSLVVEPKSVDLIRFEEEWAAARLAGSEQREGVAAQIYDNAAQLWRGDALAEFSGLPFGQWEKRRLSAMRTNFLGDRIDALLRVGKGSELVGELESMVAMCPYEERFRAQLMQALYRSGQQLKAIKVAEETRLALIEVGLIPGNTIRAMETRILQQDPELDHWSWPFSPLSPPETYTRLVGRETEVEDLVKYIAHGPDRIITVTGPGGVGKTRLGIEASRRYLAEGRSPVAYVAVSELRDPALVSAAVSLALGLPESWKERSVPEVARAIGRAPILIVLDGAEHMIDQVRSVVADLLGNGPQIRILLTSRTPLSIGGERQVRLLPLSTSPPVGSRTDQRWAPAIELFLDRCAGLVGPDLSDKEVEIASEICQKLDGLPLAIELAAARTPTLGIVGLRDRLGSRLDLLSGPSGGPGERHGSLRAVMEWSYGLLSRSAQVLLSRLAVFAGGLCIYHLEEMWPDVALHEHAQSLDELLRNSLLSRIGSGGLPRFSILDTVREFSYELLAESGEAADVNERLAAWILDRLESAAGRFGAGAVQFEEIEVEVENARAAMSGLLDLGDGDAALRYANGLYVWWMYMVRRSEEAAWLESALRLPATSNTERARALLNLGRIRAQDSEAGASSRHLESAAQLFAEAGEQRGLCETLVSLSENAALIGCTERSSLLLSQASVLADDAADEALQARVAVASAILSIMSEDYGAAVATCTRTLELPIAQSWAELRIKTLSQLAEASRNLGEMDMALDALEEAIDLAQSTRNRESHEFALAQYALTLHAAGRYEEAVAASQRCLGATSGVDPDPRSLQAAAAVLISAPDGVDGHLRGLAREIFATIAGLYPHVRLADRDLRVLSPDLGSICQLGASPPTRSRSGLLRLLRGVLEGLGARSGAED